MEISTLDNLRIVLDPIGQAGVTIALIVHFCIWALVAFSLLLSIVLLNYKFYAFFAREKQPLFAVLVVPLHLCYYLYSGVSLVTGTVLHFWKTRVSNTS